MNPGLQFLAPTFIFIFANVHLGWLLIHIKIPRNLKIFRNLLATYDGLFCFQTNHRCSTSTTEFMLNYFIWINGKTSLLYQ